MNPENRKDILDRIGLVIIGAGASILIFALESIIVPAGSFFMAVPVGVMLIISVFTQYLLNKIKDSQRALRQANATLEANVRKRTADLRESENKYRAIFENTCTATIIADAAGTISLANSTFMDYSTTNRQEIENRKSWLDFLDDSSRLRMTVEISKHWKGESVRQEEPCVHEGVFVTAAGQRRNVLIYHARIAGSDAAVVSFADITALKEAEKQISHQAFHDTLTGLPNRALFMEHLTMAMQRAHRRLSYHFAVLYMDIDRFKVINESLGHHIGDQLLQAYAARLRKALRNIDNLARFGGDEFAILLEDVESSEFALKVAQRLQSELQLPFTLEEQEIYAPASCGIVFDTGSYNRPEDIIRDADAAMYLAKDRGRAQFQVFDPQLHEKIRERHQLETDLRKAADQNEFELHYQPIVSIGSGAVIGFEALIRWNHPAQGQILPDTFIPIAEETGLIIPIGRWVLREACRDMVGWQKSLPHRQGLLISVNISGKQFQHPKLLDEVLQILSESKLPPDQLKLEITETALMENTDETVGLIEQLKKAGIKIVIDDFGTGYSSMSYLQQLPIDTLKVDRSFISKMSNVLNESKKIVETIIVLAHKLNLNVVAEGVETREQHSMLSAMNCQLGQGHLYSRPLEKAQMRRLVADRDRFDCLNPQLPYQHQPAGAASKPVPAIKPITVSHGLHNRGK